MGRCSYRLSYSYKPTKTVISDKSEHTYTVDDRYSGADWTGLNSTGSSGRSSSPKVVWCAKAVSSLGDIRTRPQYTTVSSGITRAHPQVTADRLISYIGMRTYVDGFVHDHREGVVDVRRTKIGRSP